MNMSVPNFVKLHRKKALTVMVLSCSANASSLDVAVWTPFPEGEPEGGEE